MKKIFTLLTLVAISSASGLSMAATAASPSTPSIAPIAPHESAATPTPVKAKATQGSDKAKSGPNAKHSLAPATSHTAEIKK